MKNAQVIGIAAGVCLAGLGLLSVPVPRIGNKQHVAAPNSITRCDLFGLSSQPLEHALDVLFIHHSCGGQLLASFGDSQGANCILKTHPNGGSLRARLEQNGYRVHEASYGSRIGENTDVFDWLPKFRSQMEDILRCDLQDHLFPDERRNRVVIFKSCFPNNAFREEGASPGNPAGPELTVWNAKAAYNALLEEFRKQPNVLFVCVTAPPLAPGRTKMPLWRQIFRKLKGSDAKLANSGRLARELANWLADTNGWLKDYPLKNVVVFDYYDILTGHGKSNLAEYPTWDGNDSHPSRAGNEKAAEAFLPMLNQATRRAGLAK